MKNARKITAMAAELSLLAMLLCACGSSASSSNTGMWIAITVMVFVAVFAATSGVVYLVLQRVLPKEEETKPVAPRPQVQRPAPAAQNVSRAQSVAAQPQNGAYRPQTSRPQNAAAYPQNPTSRPQNTAAYPQSAAPRPQTAASRVPTGEWICPRDHSRNSGPFCVLCGASRPQPKSAANPAAGSASARPVQPNAWQESRYQQPARQQPQVSAQPVYQPVQRPAQPQSAVSDDDLFLKSEDTDFFSADSLGEEEAPVSTYTGKFAKKAAPAAAPAQQPAEPEDDVPYDADLLAAIFRDAEREGEEK